MTSAEQNEGERMLRPVTHADLAGLPVDVAPTLLGAELHTVVDGVAVALRITEVEAYHGLGTGGVPDPGSHARMGPTARNATMWGPQGHLYVYLSHGIHSCINVVCGPEGEAGGVLLRAGEVVDGADAVAERRGVATPLSRIALRDLARGPGRFGQALGLQYALHNGLDIIEDVARNGATARLLLGERVPEISAGPRVGVAGVAGTMAFPWRFWITGDPTVSPFRWGRGAKEAAAALGADGIGD
ncbi:DNA-3-methyladenine glycosylase II [Microbacterium esteraromaticum]|uniref:Putative 3-methyladenine DNA glycosylase n=1 Tax=Microbacterium esteraromaticum TaxID=57043 RepID=A0A1R4IBV7_9MICO|nr:DNA-3-methyladenine glycosylase [Microbacterium esteraromaticum]SJN17219.1 DNA-3-methyladenine glycosylase II [Microbacterium esteraromaticum]